MTPFFFGSSKRRLFGVYTARRAMPGRERAALVCYPWGSEYINAHRSLVRLSAMLADRGYHVLRFDYYGSGDSAGETTEPTLAGWREDIETALDELRSMSGVDRTSLVGLRLGATLAAEVAADDDEIDDLVLWDPVVEGAEYLEAIRQSSAHLDEGIAPPEGPDGIGPDEVMGFPLPDGLRAEIEGIDLPARVPDMRSRCLVAVSEPLGSHDRLAAALEPLGPDATLESFDDHRPWRENWPVDTGRLPTRVLEAIATWMRR